MRFSAGHLDHPILLARFGCAHGNTLNVLRLSGCSLGGVFGRASNNGPFVGDFGGAADYRCDAGSSHVEVIDCPQAPIDGGYDRPTRFGYQRILNPQAMLAFESHCFFYVLTGGTE